MNLIQLMSILYADYKFSYTEYYERNIKRC